MSNVYVLMEEGWEYNDETYFHPDSGSGTPVKVFETYEAATAECNSRNIESFRDLFVNAEANQYFYNFEDIIVYSNRKNGEKQQRMEELLQIIFGCDMETLDGSLESQSAIEPNPDVSDSTWLEFLSMTTMNFWNVVECERE
jgi:hypothetical protein